MVAANISGRVVAALANANSVRNKPTKDAPAVSSIPTRRVAIGDPQTTAPHFFEVIDAHGLLSEDGWLDPSARLITMGDYFDIAVEQRTQGQIDGELILGWLAVHAPHHVTIVLGNHDLARVMEFAYADDAQFAAAATHARTLLELPREQREPGIDDFVRAFPQIPTPGYAVRDYNAFTVAQRDLVQRLLLARRAVLAVVAQREDSAMLLTHAGITGEQLAMLRLAQDAGPDAIAQALNARLERAVLEVEASWGAGETRALSLEPLHVAGKLGREGGGLLYHRPAELTRPCATPAWERDPLAPRRFDPRALPHRIVQVFAHTGHRKAYSEMPSWREPDMTNEPGGLRTVSVDRTRDTVLYRRGIAPPTLGHTTAYMIDPEMRHIVDPARVAILSLDT